MNNFYKDKAGSYEIDTVELEDVDSAVFDYFDKKLAVTVDSERGSYKVPIFFSSGERWALIRKQKFRDEHGTLILPIVSIRRTDIERTRGFGGLAQEVKSITISSKIHPKTGNIKNLFHIKKDSGIYAGKEPEPVYESVTIPFPDFCQVLYEITIWSQFNVQMNEILEKIFYRYEHLDGFVMPVNYEGNSNQNPKGDGYYFVGFREGIIEKLSNDENFTDQERIIKYKYTIRVPVYLILDPDDESLSYGRDEKGRKILFKKQTANQVQLKESIVSLEEFEKLFGKSSFLK